MTTTLEEERAANLRLALEVSIAGDTALLPDLYTDDVKGWSPALSVSSRDELAVELEQRVGAFTDVDIVVRPIDIADDHGYAEWSMAATHSGPLVLDDDVVVDATGRRLELRGVTVAEFRGPRIKAFRQYWDETAFVQGLGLLADG
jgi:ketosteroid isomerase-like protein